MGGNTRLTHFRRPAAMTEIGATLSSGCVPAKARFPPIADPRGAESRLFAVRPEGAYHQWRKDPSRELSIALVADERFGRATGWIEAS